MIWGVVFVAAVFSLGLIIGYLLGDGHASLDRLLALHRLQEAAIRAQQDQERSDEGEVP